MEPKIPNIETDKISYALNSYEWLKTFTNGDHVPDMNMPNPEKAKLDCVTFEVKSIKDLSRRSKKFRLHPKFRGLDIKSLRMIEGKKRHKKSR